MSYSAQVRWPDGERSETLGATTGLRDVTACTPGVLALPDGEHQVAVWRVPLDPGLPGLAAACDPDAVAALLASLGVAGAAGPGTGAGVPTPPPVIGSCTTRACRCRRVWVGAPTACSCSARSTVRGCAND